MRRRQRPVPARIEAPEWYRVYHPEEWDAPDAEELRLLAGLPDSMLPGLHDCHCHRRWATAQHAYRQQHPRFAEQEFSDLIARAAERRQRRL